MSELSQNLQLFSLNSLEEIEFIKPLVLSEPPTVSGKKMLTEESADNSNLIIASLIFT